MYGSARGNAWVACKSVRFEESGPGLVLPLVAGVSCYVERLPSTPSAPTGLPVTSRQPVKCGGPRSCIAQDGLGRAFSRAPDKIKRARKGGESA